MKRARINGKTVAASPEAPERGFCPACGADVQKRHRTCMDGNVTYFYRHQRGQGKDCPKRYRPT